MHPSNIQLQQYFLLRFDFSVNSAFDPEQDVELVFEDFVVEVSTVPLNQETRRKWHVQLTVRHGPRENQNSPYAFSAEVIGLFDVCDGVGDEQIDLYIKTNATSVLYSTVREIVCTMTAKGPHGPLLLPTASFYEPPAPPAADSASEAESDRED